MIERGEMSKLDRELGKTWIMIALLLMSVALMIDVPRVKASGTMYVRADGSVNPLQHLFQVLTMLPVLLRTKSVVP